VPCASAAKATALSSRGLTGELGRINQACAKSKSRSSWQRRVARVLIAERCPAFLETYYCKQYRPAAGSVLTRLRRRVNRGPLSAGRRRSGGPALAATEPTTTDSKKGVVRRCSRGHVHQAVPSIAVCDTRASG